MHKHEGWKRIMGTDPWGAAKRMGLALTLLAVSNCKHDEPDAAKAAPAAAVAADLGVGPVQSLPMSALDGALAQRGQKVFETVCVACHKFDQRLVGPPLAGVTQRRRPEWIMNMMLNTQEMLQKNDTAKQLLAQYVAPMAVPTIQKDDARAVLEYLRQHDGVN